MTDILTATLSGGEALHGALAIPFGGGVEVDPTVPQWAKQPSKPTYTAREIGAVGTDGALSNLEILAIFGK